MQVLIVEDDVRLSDALAQILRNNNYQVDTVYDGADGLAYAESGIYDVVVLDVMLPKMDGFQVVSELRRRKVTTPVLMLTARDNLKDKIDGLDSGADDYMTKPFAPAELMARLRSLSRRQGEVQFETVEFGDISLNLETCELSRGDKSIHLALKEFSIMHILMSNTTRITSKELLISKVWGVESTAEDNNVEAYVSFLRKKLRFLGSRVKISTLRKMGYRLEDPQAGDASADAAEPVGAEA